MLVNPPIRLNRPPYIHPFGLGIIANMLRASGHDVDMADMNTTRTFAGAEFRPPARRPDLIGISGIISTFRVVRDLVPFLRDRYPNVPIVVGGGGITSAPEVYMRSVAADIGVLGEGEYTALELAGHFETGHPKLGDIAGITYPHNGKLASVARRPPEKNLDAFPLPAFDLFDMEAYISHPKYSKVAGKEAAILATRGCPFECNFCYHVFGRGVRYRSVARVIEEIEFLKSEYGVGALLFADECMTARKSFVRELCQEMIARNLQMDWAAYARVDSLDDKTAALMARAGCSLLGFGLESGSQKILDAMNKKVTVQEAKDGWALAKRHFPRVAGTLIMGYPGETPETVQETIDFGLDIEHAGSTFFLCPYPGTQVFEEHKDKIIEQCGGLDAFFSRIGDAGEFTVNLNDYPDEWIRMQVHGVRGHLGANRIYQKWLRHEL